MRFYDDLLEVAKMKFRIAATDYWIGKEFCEAYEAQLKPFEIKFETIPTSSRFIPKDDVAVIEVNSLEELLMLAEKSECELIIGLPDKYCPYPQIEVYDGYRE